MSSGQKIGDFSEKRGDLEVEWTVYDIFSYSKEDECYESPCFFLAGVKFRIQIYPYGRAQWNSVGWISLYLKREDDSSSPTSVNCTFGLIRADGRVEKIHPDISWVFDGTTEGFGSPKFIERSKLLERKTELVPSDALTLTCSLRVNQDFDSPERLDALSEDLKNIFLSARGCDLTINVKNEAFPAHKYILAARSPVFADMLGIDIKQKQMGIVNIDDCDPDPFKYFLMYLYSGKLENLSSNAFELYKIADKYQVKELKAACVGSIMGNLSLENVCNAILVAHEFKEVGLKIKTQKFFNENFSKIVSSDEWESLMKENYRAANGFLKIAATKMKLIE